MYRPTFAVDAIGRDEPAAVVLALKAMGHMLLALVAIDEDLLRAMPGHYPPLYEAGIAYDAMVPAPGSACGDDDWADLATVYRLKRGDCEDLAAIRVAECHVRWGLTGVTPHIFLDRNNSSRARHLYHIVVRWPEGLADYPTTVRRIDGMLIEDPSLVLGMKTEEA